MKTTKTTKKRIAFPTLNGREIFNRDQIIYVKAANSQCDVFMMGKDRAIVVNKPLKEFEEELIEDDFVRIHRSYLINYNHIIRYIKGKGGIVIMSNNDDLEVADDRKEILLAIMEWSS
jgi:two-component system LytT family response regulator